MDGNWGFNQVTKKFYQTFWSVLAGLGVVDWILSSTLHIEVRNLGNGLIPPAILLALAGIFSVVFRRKYRRLSDVCHIISLNFLGGYFALILTYCAGTSFHPLVDNVLNGFDVFLGFDWPWYFRYAHDHRWLFWLLALAYASTPWQVVLSALYWAHRGDRRVQEMMWILFVGLLASIGIFWLFPAQNPLFFYGITGTNADDWVKTIAILRQHSGAVLDVTNPLGLISFPSYHSTVAITMVYMHWGRNWRSALMLALNTLLIASTPVIGGHYLSDTLAGIVLGVVVISLMKWREPLAGEVVRIVFASGRWWAAGGESSLGTARAQSLNDNEDDSVRARSAGVSPVNPPETGRTGDGQAASRRSPIVLALNAAAAIWAITWIIVYMAPSDFSPLWGLWASRAAPAAVMDPAPARDTVIGRVVQYGSFIPAILLFLASNVVRERIKRRRCP